MPYIYATFIPKNGHLIEMAVFALLQCWSKLFCFCGEGERPVLRCS